VDATHLALVKQALVDAKIPQRLIAKRLGLSRSHVCHVLNGQEVSQRVMDEAARLLRRAKAPLPRPLDLATWAD
jgi:predicted XRE-type DNA-binding protein